MACKRIIQYCNNEVGDRFYTPISHVSSDFENESINVNAIASEVAAQQWSRDPLKGQYAVASLMRRNGAYSMEIQWKKDESKKYLKSENYTHLGYWKLKRQETTRYLHNWTAIAVHVQQQVFTKYFEFFAIIFVLYTRKFLFHYRMQLYLVHILTKM